MDAGDEPAELARQGLVDARREEALFDAFSVEEFDDRRVEARAVLLSEGPVGVDPGAAAAAAGGLGGFLLGRFMADKSIPQGAATTVWAAVAPDVPRGECGESG